VRRSEKLRVDVKVAHYIRRGFACAWCALLKLLTLLRCRDFSWVGHTLLRQPVDHL